MVEVAEVAQVAPAPRKALVIDDFYARPTSAEVRRYTAALRQFITDSAGAGLKEWLDANFGLSGDHRQLDYFDPLLADSASVQRFWTMRNTSPVGERLSTEILSALVDELRPAHASLRNIEDQLHADGWVVKLLAKPPSVDSVDADVSLIVIDYILVPGDAAAGLRMSTDFLKEILDQAKNSASATCPFVLLMSENPDAERDAESFRASVNLHSPYFRFSKKADLSRVEVNQIVARFEGQRGELESYRKLHVELEAAAKVAAGKLTQSIKELELQDLATLHAGQLVQEGEPLSDYMAWLYGQYLTAEMVRHANLAKRAASLPTASYKVLLGHLSASENIPKLFATLSLAYPASAAKHKAVHNKLQVRFGDLFVYQAPAATPEPGEEGDLGAEILPRTNDGAVPESAQPPRPSVSVSGAGGAAPGQGAVAPVVAHYLLVISQTCDLFHRNITNGQVLCVDGDAHPLGKSESDLLRATIRQMDQQGRILLKDGANYVEVEWRSKDVRTVEESKLCSEEGYRYLGRLNELYALQGQHNALDELGRIGVPIQPSYSIFFKKVTLTVFSGTNEMVELGAVSAADMIVAVLRNEKAHTPIGGKPKKSKHRLLFSEDIRSWLIEELKRIGSAATLPTQLKPHVDQFCAGMEQRANFSLIVKVQKDNVAGFAQEKIFASGELDPVAPKDLNNMVAVELKEVFDVPARSNTRLQITFEKISS